ncbi:hypothetical protein M2316_003136 [Cellulosimicrobium cellulans]|nr:hypothetical protein [Cellulosimicrobium cellulans]
MVYGPDGTGSELLPIRLPVRRWSLIIAVVITPLA